MCSGRFGGNWDNVECGMVPVTPETARTHYALGLRVRHFEYGEHVAFQMMMASAYLGKWDEADHLLGRLQKHHPEALNKRVSKLASDGQRKYAELVKRHLHVK